VGDDKLQLSCAINATRFREDIAIVTRCIPRVLLPGVRLHCTLAVTDASPASVNVHDFVLFPALEHAPDQIPSRPFEIVSVIDVPVVNGADPVPPTATLIPAGLEVTRSPLRPVAVTVSVAVPVAAGDATVSAAVRVTPAAVAVMVATVDAVTDVVAMAAVALVAPAATVTFAGTVAAVLLLVSVTLNPAGAADVNVTVACADVPPGTLAGLTETADNEAGGGGGVTVSVAVFAAPLYTPVIVTGVDALTAVVVTLNVALVAPAATVTLAGTVATAVLLPDSVTTAAPAGAALVNVAVPCAAAPPTTLAGLRPIADSAAAAAAAAFGWKRSAADHAPAVPAELMPRTRHQCRTLANPPIVNCDGVTV